MKRIIIILSMLVAMPSMAQDFNVASWDMAKLFLKDGENNFYYAFMDAKTLDRAIMWRALHGEKMVLSMIYIKRENGDCYALSPSYREDGSSTLYTQKGPCAPFERITSWFVKAQRPLMPSKETVPLEKQ